VRLHELKPAPGSRSAPRRVGRGPGSGRGKTSGRGHKGQKARSGYSLRPGFEGGQMPLQRRLPKRGFSNFLHRRVFAEVNVDRLNRFEDGTIVTPELLRESRLVGRIEDGVKILGSGDLERSLMVKAHKFSRRAIAKIEAAGGKVEVI